jgi:alpha-amylase/alpha-mannosidase (GH57 family)
MSAPTSRSIVIHGHFYQPPREDPWLDEVETEPSAAPFHDWNERIEQECYRAVAAARIPGPGGRIARIVNAYEWISFDFGPTLLEWLEHAAPETYAEVLAADRASAARLGHGNAVAMPYHHSILPLSSFREKVLEVRWGIADFQRRFGRPPAGMWLPETAVDEETLDVLAREGIRFTILAPHQVDRAPPLGLPGLVRTAAGRSIAVFIYDGPISHDVAFGPLVRDGEAWSDRLTATPATGPAPRLISVATDGETYGHHHRFAEMALVHTVERVRERSGVTVDNFASFLARHGAEHEVRVVEPSAWSCAHGVERWRSNCGCRIAPEQPTSQEWRTPLRDAIGWLTTACHEIYEREAPRLINDPEGALAGYGAVIGAGAEAVREYGGTVARDGLPDDERVRLGELLEMERGALRTLTSCAWFFDDVAGIESLQVLRYAAWVITLAGSDTARLEEGFIRRLAPARSNVPAQGTGRDIYLDRARPAVAPPARIAAGLAAARAFAPEAATSPAWLIDGPAEALVLTNRRTGHRYIVRVDLEQDGLQVHGVVRSAVLDQPVSLVRGDLPERQRTAIAAALRGQALDRLLTPEERQAQQRGEEVRLVIRRALGRLVRCLASAHDDSSRRDVVILLDMLDQLGEHIPFEVQTVFYRIWQNELVDDPRMLDLARRMGFGSRPSVAMPAGRSGEA